MTAVIPDSYSRFAPRPRAGTEWIWEPHLDRAPQIVEVMRTEWDGEKWWVLIDREGSGRGWNDLALFWEAVQG